MSSSPVTTPEQSDSSGQGPNLPLHPSPTAAASAAPGPPLAPWPSFIDPRSDKESWVLTRKTPRYEFKSCWFWCNVKIPLIMTFTFRDVRFLRCGPRVFGFLILPHFADRKQTFLRWRAYSHFPKSAGILFRCRNITNIMPINFIIVETTHSEPPTRPCYAYQFELPSMKTYYDITRGRLYFLYMALITAFLRAAGIARRGRLTSFANDDDFSNNCRYCGRLRYSLHGILHLLR